MIYKPTLAQAANNRSYLHHPRYRGCQFHAMMADGNGTAPQDYALGTATSVSTAMWGQAGNFGPCMTLNGTSEYLWVANFSFPVGTQISVSMWVRTAGNPSGGFAFSIGNSDFPHRLAAAIPWNDNILYWDCGDIANGRLNTDYSNYLNKWTHIVLISGGTANTFKAIYLNGNLVNSANASSGPGIDYSHMKFGSWNTYYQNGQMDEMRVYNRILTAAEVYSLYKDPFLEFRAPVQPRSSVAEIIAAGGFPSRMLLQGVGQ